MFSIRKEQMEALSRARVSDYEDRMVKHFSAPVPPMGEAELRELIRYGIQRAARHGVVTERDVAVYIGVMVALGRDFDVDPRLPWAAAVLGDPSTRTPFERVNQLLEAAAAQRGGA